MPRLFLGNLSYDLNEATLASVFKGYGVDATDIKLITDRESGRPRGFGFCEVKDAEEAILRLNGQTIAGRPITVNVAKERERTYRPNADRSDKRGGNDDWGGSERRGRR